MQHEPWGQWNIKTQQKNFQLNIKQKKILGMTVAKTEWNMIKCTTQFSQLMCSHKKVSSHLGCWANREGRGKLFTISPFTAVSRNVWQLIYTWRRSTKWNATGAHARPVWVYDMKSFEKYLAGKKLLQEKTFSTDWFDSLVNNCSVKYGIQRPHQQFFAEMFDYSDSGEAQSQSFCDKGRKKQRFTVKLWQVLNGLWLH